MATPVLYAHPFSSYSQKVLIAFYEKDAPFELRLLPSEHTAAAAECHALWPLDKFPVLHADGRTVVESSVIVEWLDLRHGGGGPLTRMMCGAVRFDHPAARNLVAMLPEIIYLDAAGSPDVAGMQATLALIAAETKGSIHSVGAAVQGAPACNGWTFWHVEEKGKMIPIDLYRQKVRAELAQAGA